MQELRALFIATLVVRSSFSLARQAFTLQSHYLAEQIFTFDSGVGSRTRMVVWVGNIWSNALGPSGLLDFAGNIVTPTFLTPTWVNLPLLSSPPATPTY